MDGLKQAVAVGFLPLLIHHTHQSTPSHTDSTAADVYSFGVVLNELLTREQPFRGALIYVFVFVCICMMSIVCWDKDVYMCIYVRVCICMCMMPIAGWRKDEQSFRGVFLTLHDSQCLIDPPTLLWVPRICLALTPPSTH